MRRRRSVAELGHVTRGYGLAACFLAFAFDRSNWLVDRIDRPIDWHLPSLIGLVIHTHRQTGLRSVGRPAGERRRRRQIRGAIPRAFGEPDPSPTTPSPPPQQQHLKRWTRRRRRRCRRASWRGPCPQPWCVNVCGLCGCGRVGDRKQGGRVGAFALVIRWGGKVSTHMRRSQSNSIEQHSRS